MKTTVFLFIISLFSIHVKAQSYEVPKNYKLVLVEDYAPYEEDVIKTVDWMINTPIIVDIAKRKEASAFLFKWISGAPKVMISLTVENSDFGNSDCLMIFMGAWARNNITNHVYDNPLESNLAGINAVIKFYNKNRKSLGKKKKIEKFIKLKKKGKLIDFIKKNMLVE